MMSSHPSEEIIIQEGELNMRLDKLLVQRFPSFSRSYFEKLIEKGLVLVNGTIVKKRYVPVVGDEIEIEFQLTSEINLEPENIALDILFEDDDILAINKPSGMVVHPAPGHLRGTFVNALLYHCLALRGIRSVRPGIVHRLDKDTTGVLLAAKNERAQRLLVELFSSRTIEKQYLAITIGNPGEQVLKGNIGRHPKDRKRMAILEMAGRDAETRMETLFHNELFALVHLFPLTGRTHQLRVQLQSIGKPILGDPLYGNDRFNQKYGVKRTLLHAWKLRFRHPINGTAIEIVAPIPSDLHFWMAQL